MQNKRFMAIAGVLLSLSVLLTACGGKETLGNTRGANGEYIPNKQLKVTIWNTQGTDYARAALIPNNVVSGWLEEKTKVTVENIYGNDGGQWDMKLYRLIAGDNLPEIVYCGSSQGPAHFAKLAEAGKIWAIDEKMLEKYAPNYFNRIDTAMLEKFKIDGKLYGLPFGFSSNKKNQPKMSEDELEQTINFCVQIASDETRAIFIRDDIAKMVYPTAKNWDEIVELIVERNEPIGDELYDIPINTPEDYQKLLYDIKGLNLVSQGKPVYAFGYDGGDNWTALSYLGGDMMGYATHFYSSSWNPVTKEIRLPILEPIVREAARIQNKMVIDKVIDPESLIHTTEMFNEKILNGQYAVAALNVAGGIQSVNDQLEKAGKPFRYRPLYSSVENKPEYKAGKQPEIWGASMGFLKTLSEEEFIQALNWLNVQSSDEFESVFWWGPEEAGLYTEDANGKRTYTDERFTERLLNGNTAALPTNETKGLGQQSAAGMIYPSVIGNAYFRWSPVIYNKKFTLTPYSYNNKALAFPADSKHSTDLELFPPCEVWSSEYAVIPEVVTYWGAREQWEQPFKIALSAGSTSEFEQKWDEAVTNLNRIVDTNEICRKMTDIAKPLYESIIANQKK